MSKVVEMTEKNYVSRPALWAFALAATFAVPAMMAVVLKGMVTRPPTRRAAT